MCGGMYSEEASGGLVRRVTDGAVHCIGALCTYTCYGTISEGKLRYLGSYGRFEDAVRARKEAEERLHDEFLRRFGTETKREGDICGKEGDSLNGFPFSAFLMTEQTYLYVGV